MHFYLYIYLEFIIVCIFHFLITIFSYVLFTEWLYSLIYGSSREPHWSGEISPGEWSQPEHSYWGEVYCSFFAYTLIFFAFIFTLLKVWRFFKQSILGTFTFSFHWLVCMNLTFFFYTHRRQRWTALEMVKSQGLKSSLIHLTSKFLPLTLVNPGFSPSVYAHFSYQLPEEFSEKWMRLPREVPRGVEIIGGQGGIVRGMEWIVDQS